jgi:hypothetical protein
MEARGGLRCCPAEKGSWQSELQFETVVYRVANFRDRKPLKRNCASLQSFHETQDARIPQSGIGSCISLMHRMRKFHFKLPTILVANFLGSHSFLSGSFPQEEAFSRGFGR